MSTPDSRGHTHRPDQTCLYILGSAESCFAFLVNPLSKYSFNATLHAMVPANRK